MKIVQWMKFKLGSRVRVKKRQLDDIAKKYFEEVEQIIIQGSIDKIYYDSKFGIIIEVIQDGSPQISYCFREEDLEIDIQYYRDKNLKKLGL